MIPPSVTPPPTTLMDVDDLSFDLDNPRLPEFDLPPDADDDDVIRLLWRTMDVKELVLSISASGFFPHEPVIVAQENGRNVVIEGNRRLAAVRILIDGELARSLDPSLPPVTPSARKALRSIPTVSDSRESAWRFLGFKHVNGPAKWSSYAKSRYVAQVHEQYNVPLADIARQIGDTHRTVQRLFRGLMVIRQAEQWQVFSREDRWRSHFAFSHLYTGIGYPGIADFLALRPEEHEEAEPVPYRKKRELGELCLWLYGSKRQETLPVIQKQNPHLRYLAAIVSSTDGLAALRGNMDIETAHEMSQPSSSVFQDSLLAAKRNLQKARGLASTGYDGSQELLQSADAVATLACDLHDEMLRLRAPRQRSRRRSAGGPR